MPHMPEGDKPMKDIFAVAEGLRGGYHQLLQELPEFLRRYVRFCKSKLESADLHSVWSALNLSREAGCGH